MASKLWLVLLLFAVTGPVQAGIYKCTGDNGAVEFRDRPCETGRQEELQVNSLPASAPVPADEEAAASPASPAPSVNLQGAWCEFAVSLTPKGEKDHSDPATWTFNADGTMSYRSRRLPIPLQGRYSLTGNLIKIDNDLIGSWRIHQAEASSLIVQGSLGGFGHWRRGGC